MSKRKLPAKIKDFFSIILKDPYRKSVIQIFLEYSHFVLTKPDIAEHYFAKFLYRKGVTNFEDYRMTHKLRDKCWTLNNPDYNSILDNKYLFELFYKKHNIRTTNSFAHNINSLFFIGDLLEQLNTKEEFLQFIQIIAGKSYASKNIFIKKNAGSGGGKGIYRVSFDELDADRDKLGGIFTEVLSSEFVFQEEVLQHDALNRINPHCVNTMRIETFTNQEGVSRIMSGVLRLGFSESYIDNTSKGGAYVGIDFSKGVLRDKALSDFTNGRARTYLVHPGSGVTFEGYQIPFFAEATEQVIAASQLIPQVKVIGWDVAITPEGPLLIEGNELPTLMAADIGQNGLGKNPVFLELLKEVSELK